MGFIITKDMYTDNAPISDMIINAKLMLNNDGRCYFIPCSKCFLSSLTMKEHMAGFRCMLPALVKVAKYSDDVYLSNKTNAARQFLNIFDKPKVMHINFME